MVDRRRLGSYFLKCRRISFSVFDLGPTAILSLLLSGAAHGPREPISLTEYFLRLKKKNQLSFLKPLMAK